MDRKFFLLRCTAKLLRALLITPLPKLFDATYDWLSGLYKKQPGDANAYFNGRIGDHNVVLCLMPHMGKGDAASAAASLKISYRRIQVALLVGICGGAPCPPIKEEIFLGDVIISDAVIEMTLAGSTGVVSGGRHVKDTLGRPNRKIQSLLAGLQPQQSRKDLQAKMLQHLQAIQDSQPRWPSYQHRHYGPTSRHLYCQAALDTTCILLGCAEDRIQRRRHCADYHSPKAHIGAFASADTVMKSGEHRDHLMEGAGIWNNISCIIIKGVYDYADSHKNKAWQAYAAAIEAATAKAFLEHWEPNIWELIGREEELNSLWDYLRPTSSQTRKVVVLHGLSGFGKTQLAIHFARKHKDDFTAILWLRGKDRSASVSSLTPASLGADQVLQWLVKPGNPRWLIIFDNIDQYSPPHGHGDGGYDVYEFFPKADHGSIMITSRLQGLTELGKSFPVQKLMHKDATQLLLQSSGFSVEDIAQIGAERDITNLASLLDGLSLAIVIAGAFMRQTGTNSQSRPSRHYQQGNMVQTWMVTFQEVQKRDPTAAKLLLLLAFFDNQDIWYELIHSGLDCSDPPPWFEMAVSSEMVFKTKVRVLIEFSLVETKQQGGSYTLHPVVQDWCSFIAASNNLTNQLYELALISVGYMVPSNSDRGYAETQQRLLPHANNLIVRGRGHWPDVNNLGNLYFNQGKLKEAEEMYQQALAGYEKALGPDHSKTRMAANTLVSLASLQAEQDTPRQIDADRQQKALGLNNLGSHLREHPRKRDILFRTLGR
ncbi:hypothetical protein BDW75DRAFT_230653 [Aspergillus navahoensis]